MPPPALRKPQVVTETYELAGSGSWVRRHWLAGRQCHVYVWESPQHPHPGSADLPMGDQPGQDDLKILMRLQRVVPITLLAPAVNDPAIPSKRKADDIHGRSSSPGYR